MSPHPPPSPTWLFGFFIPQEATGDVTATKHRTPHSKCRSPAKRPTPHTISHRSTSKAVHTWWQAYPRRNYIDQSIQPQPYATLDVNAAAKYIENSYRVGAHAFRAAVTSIMRRSRCSAFCASSSPPGGSRKTVLLKMWILQPACPGLVNVAAT